MAQDDTEWISQLAAQDAPPPDYDVFERAAQRVRAPYSRPVEGPGIGGGIGQLAEPLVSQPSWLERATEQSVKDQAAFQMGGVAGLMADTSVGQELAGGFGGVTKAVGKPVIGALADVAAPPFYSAAGRAVDAAKLGKGTPEQWLGYLRNQPGVKPEELERVFGNLPQGGPLTKADMQAHAAENAVQLGEVVKGIAPDAEAAGRALAESHGHVWPEGLSLAERERYIRTADGRRLTDYGGDPKYSQWQLPGGENYRETLLTLPNADTAKAARMTALEQRLRSTDGGEFYTPELSALRDEYKQLADEMRNNKTFQSSHWDEPNVLAHIRMNDREVPGVGKSLHLEEIQSDWHQKGRQQGYAREPDTSKWQAKPSSTGPEGLTNREGWWNVYGEDGSRLGTVTRQSAATEADAIAHIAKRDKFAGVPDAPFKTTWPDVALKRAIREAAEGGYDALSWTPGEAQAARYRLSNQLKELQYIKHKNGAYEIAGTTKSGEGFNHPDWVTAEKLPDVVGKEMAQKIINDEGKRTRGQNYNGGYFDGIDLNVGGEGMKAFYDKMLVDKANALGKKHGARVEQAELGKPSTSYLPQSVRDNIQKDAKSEPVHVLRITPELRAAAMKGFPLFTAGGVVAGGAMGELARQDKYE